MTFKEAAAHYYNSFDMNCAEAVLHGADDVLKLGLKGEDYKLLGAFGAGCGCGSMCGAVASGVAIIGKVNIENNAHGSDATKKAGLFVREVKRRLGGEMCVELRKKYHNKEDRCGITVSLVAEVLDDLWNELKK